MKNFQNKNITDNLREIDGLVCKFDNYLDLERGLSQSTRHTYCAYTRIFLNIEFELKKIRIKDFFPKDVFKFILTYSQAMSSSKLHSMIYSLRAFFRFLERSDLADCVPSVPRRQHNLPEFLSKKQLQVLLENCNRNTAIGIRDYTIFMLLIHLGLRGSEISNLTLGDFDWDNSEIIVRGKDSISRLPISQSLGNALVDYLRRARPTCSCDSFFVRSHQPQRGLISASISAIVRSGLNRACLTPWHKGAHLLRHSFATHLLSEGKSLHEISMVLRHKSIRTTAIYAHVDFNKLRSLALPWPVASKGGRS
ncbi:MAG: tyrosine-type recombinase/integrase [Parachlamydiaceae bacterium]|nr:tyrosine-type recombinase/integrase [Parachlamydiaceae bacterium]